MDAARRSSAAHVRAGLDSVITSRVSSGGTVSSSSGGQQATIASRVAAGPIADSALASTSSMLGSLQTSSFDVIKRIQMMLPGWRNHESPSNSLPSNPVAEGDPRERQSASRSGSTALRTITDASLVNYPSLQLSQLRECSDPNFDSVDTVEQFV